MQPGHQTAEVAADRDAAGREREHEVDQQRSAPSPLCQIGIRRARATTISAPKTPKIAVEAPSVGASRLEQQRAERARQQRGEVDRGEVQAPDRRLERSARRSTAKSMLKPMWRIPSCRNPAVSSRQYSWVP